MKLTSKQLRKIVNEEVAKLHEVSPDAHDESVETYHGTWLAKAIADSLFEHRRDIVAAAMKYYTDEMGDDITAPARYEDIDSFARDVATRVLNDSEVRDEVANCARRMLRLAMKPK